MGGVTSGALHSFDEVQAMERPLHDRTTRRRRKLPPVKTVPEGNVKSGGSGQSTLQITPVKRPANNDSTGKGEEVPASRRCMFPPASSASRASSSPSAVRARPSMDLNNYGSEEDADSDDEDEDLVQPVQMPRRAERLFMSEVETEVPPINANIGFEWPPQLSSGLQPQPSAQPKPGPNTEPEPIAEPEPSAEPEPNADFETIAEPFNKFDFRLILEYSPGFTIFSWVFGNDELWPLLPAF
ncbi:unnamed protein product [Colias eurytheme]|nr:unnamed protein product [Colias eurytheme]